MDSLDKWAPPRRRPRRPRRVDGGRGSWNSRLFRPEARPRAAAVGAPPRDRWRDEASVSISITARATCIVLSACAAAIAQRYWGETTHALVDDDDRCDTRGDRRPEDVGRLPRPRRPWRSKWPITRSQRSRPRAEAEAFLSHGCPRSDRGQPQVSHARHRLRQALADQGDHVLASRGRRRHRIDGRRFRGLSRRRARLSWNASGRIRDRRR